MSTVQDHHMISLTPDANSPDGSAEIGNLLSSPQGDLTHAVCPAGAVSSVHELPELYEAYYILAGRVEIWRQTADREGVTTLRPGRWVEMPPGTRFQYRAHQDASLIFLVVVLPTWRPELFHTVPGGIWSSDPIRPPTTSSAQTIDGWMSGDLAEARDYLAPDGSEIRQLSDSSGGGLALCTLHPGAVSSPVRHRTVHEIWFVTDGSGELWRSTADSVEQVLTLWPGMSVEIPVGTAFQFRSTGVGPLRVILLTMPRWPGPDEAVPAHPGRW